MKQIKWKTEYSLIILAIFAGTLLLIPMSFASKAAVHVSKWNSEYNKIEYMFSAMSAQAESDIVENLKNAKTGLLREKYMIELVKPYLRLEEPLKKEKYNQRLMNGKQVPTDDLYYFDTLYNSRDGMVIGVKEIENKTPDSPVFIMMIDTNGYKKPNMWGRDIFGLNIYKDGNVNPIGYGWNVDNLRKDCSKNGTGLSCSYFYRIGGEFVE